MVTEHTVLNCGHEKHAAMKADRDHFRSTAAFVAVFDDGWEVFEMYNCSNCTGTFTIDGIGPKRYFEGV